MMQVLIQRAVSQQAMANMMQAAGMPAPDMPGGGRSGPQVIGPSVGLAAALKSIENLMTNRYRDHEAPEDQNCELFPYRERKTKCPNGNAHHVVPDHCWRMGSGIQKLLPAMRASAELDDALPHSEGACYHKNMQKADGLSICVDGKGKTGTHGKIHDVFDPAELALGQKGNPPYTAKLGDLEAAAARAVALVTGCPEENLHQQLRDYHDGKALNENTLLRADPFGKNTTSPTDYMADPVIRSGTTGVSK